METMRIIGVPEHFNYPWLKVVESQPFLDEDIKLVWGDESRGSGAMNKAIREGNTDIAIILTESFIKDKIEGNPGCIVGSHVQSPLIWGIHVSGKSLVKEFSEVRNAPFLISRSGSGSHLMAYLLAEREGLDIKDLEFEVIGNLDGAKRAFQSSIPKIFLWEKYTTKPLVDNGAFKRIGEIPTPWPCFVIVASNEVLKNHAPMVKKLRDAVYEKNKSLFSDPTIATTLSDYYKIRKEDIQAWLSQTSWAENNKIEAKSLENTMDVLKRLELISKKIKPEQLVSSQLVDLN